MANPDYLVNWKTEGFLDVPRWTALIDDVEIIWMPTSAPYIFSGPSDLEQQVVDQIIDYIQRAGGEQEFMLAVPGLTIYGGLSNPYMVKYAIQFLYESVGAKVFYSINAPLLPWEETAEETEEEDLISREIY